MDETPADVSQDELDQAEAATLAQVENANAQVDSEMRAAQPGGNLGDILLLVCSVLLLCGAVYSYRSHAVNRSSVTVTSTGQASTGYSGATETLPAPSGAPVAWNYALNTALAQSQSTGKPVLVDFYTDWCEWCKKMDQSTYSDPGVQQQMQYYIPVKINAEQDTASAAKYGVNAYPTIAIIDGNGNLLFKSEGYSDAGPFASMLGKYHR